MHSGRFLLSTTPLSDDFLCEMDCFPFLRRPNVILHGVQDVEIQELTKPFRRHFECLLGSSLRAFPFEQRGGYQHH